MNPTASGAPGSASNEDDDTGRAPRYDAQFFPTTPEKRALDEAESIAAWENELRPPHVRFLDPIEPMTAISQAFRGVLVGVFASGVMYALGYLVYRVAWR